MDINIILVLLLTSREVFSQDVCTKTAINSCGDCIKSGPSCVWCKQLNFTQPGEQEATRCDTKEQLIVKGCTEAEIISPGSTLSKVKDVPLTTGKFSQKEPVQLQPQEIKLDLRPGQPKTFQVSFKRVAGYPVDLYYLMDLSYSMKDDLKNIQGLGQDLFQTLKEITNDARIGFGSFVDKTVLPFTNTNVDKLRKPCPEIEQQCQAAFGYKHVLSMTANQQEFKAEVSKQYISGNLDSPEGSLDAVMQAAVCGDQIGWRNSSTRLIVLATDAGFHMAGDGKLAGILEPNDEQCHMNNNVYSESPHMDYPSVGQVAIQLEKNNIQPIFAVTKDVAPVYMQLSEMIPKSAVGVLSSDSSNVVGLIKDAYRNLSSQVTVTNGHLPNNVRVTYTPICPNKGPAGDIKGVCNGVMEGQKIDFDVTVTADKCLEETSFLIGPLGIKDKLKVTLSTRCKCECDDPEGNHLHCRKNGQVSCGMCSCNAGFLGQNCECAVGTGDEGSLRAACRRDNGTECEGRGDCLCGTCYCHGINGGGTYQGTHCECDDFHCEPFHNKMCGGNGKCDCGTCICDRGYEGSACQCETSVEQCRAPSGWVCSGRGTCTCNRCSCIEGYRGLYCEEGYGGASPCQTKQKCIECLGFGTGPFSKNCSLACTSIFRHKMVESLPAKSCKQKDTEGCWMLFEVKQLDGVDNYTAEIQSTRECPELPNIYAIIGGSIAGVALIGILILLLVKALIYVKDRKEFRKFENEKKKSKWAKADNPLFMNATTTVANPIFTGE